MRGEHWWHGYVDCVSRGSSPHARGAHTRKMATKTDEGVIPACAGSTLSSVMRNRVARGHPRMRGEHQQCPARCLAR